MNTAYYMCLFTEAFYNLGVQVHIRGRKLAQLSCARVSIFGDQEIDGLCQVSSRFTLIMLTIYSLSECHRLAPASAADLFNKGGAMCYHVFVSMHVKDP